MGETALRLCFKLRIATDIVAANGSRGQERLALASPGVISDGILGHFSSVGASDVVGAAYTQKAALRQFRFYWMPEQCPKAVSLAVNRGWKIWQPQGLCGNQECRGRRVTTIPDNLAGVKYLVQTKRLAGRKTKPNMAYIRDVRANER